MEHGGRMEFDVSGVSDRGRMVMLSVEGRFRRQDMRS